MNTQYYCCVLQHPAMVVHLFFFQDETTSSSVTTTAWWWWLWGDLPQFVVAAVAAVVGWFAVEPPPLFVVAVSGLGCTASIPLFPLTVAAVASIVRCLPLIPNIVCRSRTIQIDNRHYATFATSSWYWYDL
jgi:hypothetical protein